MQSTHHSLHADVDPTEQETLLDETRLFREFGPEARSALRRATSAHKYKAGSVILVEGEGGDSMYVIFKGSADVRTRRVGGEVSLGTLRRGGFFGEVSVISGKPRTATVVAAEDSILLRIDGDALRTALKGHTRALTLLQTVILGRARATIEKLMGR